MQWCHIETVVSSIQSLVYVSTNYKANVDGLFLSVETFSHLPPRLLHPSCSCADCEATQESIYKLSHARVESSVYLLHTGLHKPCRPQRVISPLWKWTGLTETAWQGNSSTKRTHNKRGTGRDWVRACVTRLPAKNESNLRYFPKENAHLCQSTTAVWITWDKQWGVPVRCHYTTALHPVSYPI